MYCVIYGHIIPHSSCVLMLGLLSQSKSIGVRFLALIQYELNHRLAMSPHVGIQEDPERISGLEWLEEGLRLCLAQAFRVSHPCISSCAFLVMDLVDGRGLRCDSSLTYNERH